MIIQNIISSSSGFPVFQGLADRGVVLDSTFNNEIDTQLFWIAYKSADYPMVTCDTTYFFTFSSDHDGGSGSYFGRCYWGKGNKMDLSDFQYLGITDEGLQIETPWLFIPPTNPNRLWMYNHVQFERGVSDNNEQETRGKYTDVGGLLDADIWTDADPIDILGFEAPQDHTGYLKGWNIDGTWKATHYVEQSLPSFITGSVQVSSTLNGQDWNRGHFLTLDNPGDNSRLVFPSYGEYFKIFGQWWWIGTDQAKVGSTLTSPTRGLVLCRSNPNLELTEQIMRLDGGVFAAESWHPTKFDDENIIHLYGTNINEQTTCYKTLNLDFLQNHV